MEYKLFEEFITLQALLKDLGIIHSGGAIKSFLADHLVYFNGELENRRGKKIRTGDTIDIPDLKTHIVLVQPNLEELEEFQQDKIEKEHVAKLVKEMNKKVQKKTAEKNPSTKAKSAPRFPGR
ncbi:S4 domain-containing protein YaaA [Streptococcus peroris]|uniref:S4 domain protein YaaA n=1 Tax=Streptococcus peroris ATCC 700780 TaxID=888746 RepID=E8KCT5_9STRE|nr:S4 domain-containing protein YaaA [Streptococcus peroris]EFX39833.1 S4 domain protein YaaA [Streptococcus peroris ATCC 700780]